MRAEQWTRGFNVGTEDRRTFAHSILGIRVTVFLMFSVPSVNSTIFEPSLWKASNWKCIFPIGLTLNQRDECFMDQGAELLLPWLNKQLWMRRWIHLTRGCDITLLLSHAVTTHFLNNDHLLHKAQGQNSKCTAKWPVCAQTSSVFVCRSPPHSVSVHQGEGRAAFSPPSLPCPQTTRHNSSLSGTVSLLSGLPLQVPADNLLNPCCNFFSIFLVFHLHWQI